MRRLLLGLLLLPAPALAQEEVSTTTLDNGLEVVVIEDHRTPAVTQMVWYHSGAADEPEGASGVAHFLEHLMFNGTDSMEKGELSETVAANGGSDNAFTSYDYTAYFQRVAADRLGLMMEMEADRMANLVLNQEDIATERQVILEERSQRTDSDPNALAGEQRSAAQYLSHPYGTPVIGWRHEMEDLSLDDAQAFYDLHYAPNNATLVVAGDVEPGAVFDMAREYYGPIPAEEGLPERSRPEEPPQRAARTVDFRDERVSQPYLARSYLAPERDPGAQQEAAALVYLAELLGGSPFTSELGQALQFDDRIALWTSAGYGGVSLDDTTFSVSVAPVPGKSLKEAEAAMDEVIAGFLEEGPDEEAMERIRTQLRASEIYARDNVQGLARRYGAGLSTSLTVEDIGAWPEILQQVTAEDVMEVARKVLQPERSVTLYITSGDGPEAAAPESAASVSASAPQTEEVTQ